MQSELATRIAESLQATLSGAERKAVAEKPTSNLAAYDAYLRGIDLFSRPGQTEENLRKAADSFAEATRLDPQFAQAWAALSQADASLYFLQFDTSPARKEAARSAAETATRLNPSSLETLLANAYYRYHIERDYDGARVLFEKIQREAPSNSDALTALARIARRQSRWNESVHLYEQAAQLNPRDAYLVMDRAWTFSMLRQYAATAEMIATRPRDQPRRSRSAGEQSKTLADDRRPAWRAGDSGAHPGRIDRRDRRKVFASLSWSGNAIMTKPPG